MKQLEPLIPTSLETGADPHVLAKQRAEGLMFQLLSLEPYYVAVRSAVMRRAETATREAQSAWASNGKQGPCPEPPGQTQVMRAIGHDAYRDAYNAAVGAHDAEIEIDMIVAARLRAANDESAKTTEA